ncbi:MAG: Rieske 2Fe-2S domain-containing protein, partial [Sandaracinaceae bacterium]|nr:Rieske 2Fe-2S domain-containing protein [Sandaracinaceae bacterium]
MDAFCPHLGAHWRSATCGEALTCRFHGWQFANTGEVVSVPYGKRSPARVGVHPSEVYYGMICAYLAPAGVSAVAPYALGRMPEIDDGRFTYRGAMDAHDVRMNLLEFAENSADVQHFAHQHDRSASRGRRSRCPAWTRAQRHLAQGPERAARLLVRERGHRHFRGKRVEGRGGARCASTGPARSSASSWISARGTMVLFQFPRPGPAAPARALPLVRRAARPRRPRALRGGHWISQWEQDLEIWETKAYRP